MSQQVLNSDGYHDSDGCPELNNDCDLAIDCKPSFSTTGRTGPPGFRGPILPVPSHLAHLIIAREPESCSILCTAWRISLDPSPYPRSIPDESVAELGFKVSLFAENDKRMYHQQGERQKKHSPCNVCPKDPTDVCRRESEVHRIPADAVGPGGHQG